MNERIRKLCSQAISDVDGIQNPDTQNMYIPDCFAEKFAELIVADCLDVVAMRIYLGPVEMCRQECKALASEIKEHFGVEE